MLSYYVVLSLCTSKSTMPEILHVDHGWDRMYQDRSAPKPGPLCVSLVPMMPYMCCYCGVQAFFLSYGLGCLVVSDSNEVRRSSIEIEYAKTVLIAVLLFLRTEKWFLKFVFAV